MCVCMHMCRYHRGYVYAGLGNGTVAVFRPEEDGEFLFLTSPLLPLSHS